MRLLAFDTATPSTVVGLARDGELVGEARHDPEAGTRPQHAQLLLALATDLLAAHGLALRDLDRIGVGVGPGTFTGLRIGVSTARALAQSTGAELVAVSTLHALALRTDRVPDPICACLDARRGEVFVAGWRGEEQLIAPRAVRPEQLADLLAGHDWTVVGDGALRYREHLAGATIPAEGHTVTAASLCELAARASPVSRDRLVPEYIRAPDATPR